jgi:type IV pilus assembly protein PilN
MIRINLLPHREQKRQARQRQFVSLAVVVAVLGVAVYGLGHVIFQAQIENQEDRNKLLKSEIAKLDEQIKEIDKLREQTQALLARKQVVETLQTNRTEAVHVLDQVVRQLPDGIYVTSLKQSGTKVTMVGYAQSNARVSTLMRNIESSPWIEGPELIEIKSVPSPAAKELRVNEFTLSFKVKRAAPPGTAAATPAAGAAGAAGAKPAASGAPGPAGAKPAAAAPAPAGTQPAAPAARPAPQAPPPAPASKKS